MAVSQYTMIYLGTLADMDPNETNRTPENYATVLGGKTFGSTNSPLFASSTRISLNDVNDNGRIGVRPRPRQRLDQLPNRRHGLLDQA